MSENKKDIIADFWNDKACGIKTVNDIYNHTTFRCGDEKHQLEVEELLKSNFINPTTKMLDLGCGTGRLCQYFCEYLNKVVGVDIGAGFIERLNSWKIENNVRNAEFFTVNFWEKDFYKRFTDQFSLVIVYGATIYVDSDDDYLNILNNLNKLMPPNGNLIIKQTTSIIDKDVEVDSVVDEDKNDKRYIAHYHTPDRIINFANRTGFRLIKAKLAYDKESIGSDLYYKIERWSNTRQMYYYFIRR